MNEAEKYQKQFIKLIIDNLVEHDAWLCSIPHGQYETYSPYAPGQVAVLIQNAIEDATEQFLRELEAEDE